MKNKEKIKALEVENKALLGSNEFLKNVIDRLSDENEELKCYLRSVVDDKDKAIAFKSELQEQLSSKDKAIDEYKLIIRNYEKSLNEKVGASVELEDVYKKVGKMFIDSIEVHHE